MSATFPSLDLEALQYFVLHSGVFIAVLGACFFLLGFWCGKKATPPLPEPAHTLTAAISAPPTAPAKIHTDNTTPALLSMEIGQVTDATTAPKPETQIAPADEAHAVALDNEKNHRRSELETASIHCPEPPAKAQMASQSTPVAPPTTAPKPAEPDAERATVIVPALAIPPELLPEPLPLFPEAEMETASDEPFSLPELPQDGVLKSITRSHGVQIPPTEAFSFLLLDAPPPPPRRRRPLPSPILFATHDGDMGRDDLTRIHGISAELEKKLNSLGVRRWQQIADWSPAEVKLVSSRLAFKDRIEREEWQTQARALTENHGSALAGSKIPEEPTGSLGVQV